MKTAQNQVFQKCKMEAQEYKCSLNKACTKKADIYGPTADENFYICIDQHSIAKKLEQAQCPWTQDGLLGEQISISHFLNK